MKIKCNTAMLVMCKNVKTGQDGKTKYYNLAVLADGGEAGNVPCSEEVYNLAEDQGVQEFIAEYNDTYKSFRLIHVVPNPSKSKQEK